MTENEYSIHPSPESMVHQQKALRTKIRQIAASLDMREPSEQLAKLRCQGFGLSDEQYKVYEPQFSDFGVDLIRFISREDPQQVIVGLEWATSDGESDRNVKKHALLPDGDIVGFDYSEIDQEPVSYAASNSNPSDQEEYGRQLELLHQKANVAKNAATKSRSPRRTAEARVVVDQPEVVHRNWIQRLLGRKAI